MSLRPPARIALALTATCCLAAGAAAAAPTVTIVEGQSLIVSGARGFAPAPGVALRQCDIVRTGPQGLLQAEFDDGGQVIVGHDSRMLFELPGTDGSAVGPELLLAGWAKVAAPQRDKALPHRIVTNWFELSIDAGVAVLQVGADGASVFVERGEALVSVAGGAASARQTVRAGHTYLHKAGQAAGSVVKGLDPAFLKAMPRSMRDTLPSMLARLKARDVQPQPAPGYDAAEAEQWFRTVAPLRACVADNLVRSGQEALARHGHDPGAIDGILGPRTQAALRAFQQQRGLAASGRFDPPTLSALEVPGRR